MESVVRATSRFGFWNRAGVLVFGITLLCFQILPASGADPRCSDFLLVLHDPQAAKIYLGEQIRFRRFAGQGEAEGMVEGSLENITAAGLTITLADGRRLHLPLAMVQLDSIELNPRVSTFGGARSEVLPVTAIQKFAERKLRSGGQVSPQEMRKLYEKAGWELVRITGSHHQYRIVRNGVQWVETISGVNGDIAPGLRKVLLKRLIESEAARNR